MDVLWQNMNTLAGPVNMLTEYAQRHFNMPLACDCECMVIYTPVSHATSKTTGKAEKATECQNRVIIININM